MNEWKIDLNNQTASKNGWIFKFKSDGEDWVGELVEQPEGLSMDEMMKVSSLARESGEAYCEALKKRH